MTKDERIKLLEAELAEAKETISSLENVHATSDKNRAKAMQDNQRLRDALEVTTRLVDIDVIQSVAQKALNGGNGDGV